MNCEYLGGCFGRGKPPSIAKEILKFGAYFVPSCNTWNTLLDCYDRKRKWQICRGLFWKGVSPFHCQGKFEIWSLFRAILHHLNYCDKNMNCEYFRGMVWKGVSPSNTKRILTFGDYFVPSYSTWNMESPFQHQEDFEIWRLFCAILQHLKQGIEIF